MNYPTRKLTKQPYPPVRRRANKGRHKVTAGLLILAATTMVVALGILTQSGPFTLLKEAPSQPTSRLDSPRPTPPEAAAISAGGGVGQPPPEPGQQDAATPEPGVAAPPPVGSSNAAPATAAPATAAPAAAPPPQSAPPQSAPAPSPQPPAITVPLPLLGNVNVQVP